MIHSDGLNDDGGKFGVSLTNCFLKVPNGGVPTRLHPWVPFSHCFSSSQLCSSIIKLYWHEQKQMLDREKSLLVMLKEVLEVSERFRYSLIE